jgi:hypothetical protein
MKAPGFVNPKAIAEHLRRLGQEVIDVTDDGPITRDDKLAQLIWNQALGWTEETRDDEGNRKLIKHPPVAWAQQYVIERREGKSPIAAQEDTRTVRTADKVRELSRTRLNKLAAVAGGPPSVKKKEGDNGNVDGNS